MAKDFLKEKEAKKKFGMKAVFFLVILLGLLVVIVLRVSNGGDLTASVFNALPTSQDAYSIAKEYIEPTLKGQSAEFSDSHFQFGKTTDSIYVIKSSVTAKDRNDEKVTTEFKIILKYNGGDFSRKKNWDLITLDEF